MAITLFSVPRYQWQCLSTDTMPTDNRVGLNDLLFQTDTGDFFIYNGTAWNAYTAPGGGGGGGSAAPVFNNAISAAPATSQNNYAPTGYTAGTTNLLILTPSANITITGIAAPSKNWSMLIYNASPTYTITFPNQSSSSTAANQFSNINASFVTLQAQAMAQVNYINAITYWVFS
jgi:hypothetical protein